jgi:HlyD family secretion protein
VKVISGLIRRWKLLATIVVTILVPTAYAASTGNLPGAQKTNQTIISPKRETIEKTLSLSGSINASEKVTLRFQGSGLLTWVGVKEGQAVKKNQAIASLDRRSLEKSLKKDMNDYLAQRSQFEDTQDQYKPVKENKLVTDEIQRILNRAEYDLQNSVIDFELQDLATRLAVLSTPIEGVVTRVTQPYAGVNITPAGAEFDVLNPKTLYFDAQLDESDIKLVQIGQPVKVTLDAFDEQSFDGKIIYVSYAPITGTSGTNYQVKISIPTEDMNKLRLFLNGDAQILLEQKEGALTLPGEALVSQSGDSAKVLVLKDGKEEEVEIKTGIFNDEKVEILSGLSSDSQVIVKKNASTK